MESNERHSMTAIRDLDKADAESSDASEDEDIQVICTVCHSFVDSKDIKSHLLIHKGEKKKRKRSGGTTSSDLNANIDDYVSEKIDKDVISRDIDYTTANDDKLNVSKIENSKRIEELSDSSKTIKNSFAKEKESNSIDQELPDGILPSPKKNTFWCKICNIKIRDYKRVFLHSKTGKHVEKQRNFCYLIVEDDFLKNGIVHVSDNIYQCSLCGCEMLGLLTVEQHVNGSHHRSAVVNKPWIAFRDTSNHQNLPEGILSSKSEDFFWCRICRVQISGYCNVLEHSKGKKHDEQRNSCLSAVDNNFSEKGIIHVRNNLYKCSICKCRIIGWISVEQHVNSSRHRETVPLQKDNSASSSLETVEKTLMNGESETNEDQLENGKCDVLRDEKPEEIDEQSCQIDENIEVPSKSCKTPWTPEDLPEGIERVFTHSKNSLLICTICNCKLSPSISVNEHVASIDHRGNGEKTIVRIDENKFHCRICNCALRSYTKAMKHLKSENHYKFKALKMSGGLNKLNALPEGIVRQANDRRFECRFCLVNMIFNWKNVAAHISSKKHQEGLQKFKSQNLGIVDDHFPELSSTCHGPSSSSFELFKGKPEEIVNEKSNPPTSNKIIDSISKFVISISNDSTTAEQLIQLPGKLMKLGDDDMFWCTLCFVEGPLEYADVHAAREEHKTKLRQAKEGEIDKKVSGASPESPHKNTTAQRLISTFNLDNQEDSTTSPAPVELEDCRKILPQSIRTVPCEICNCMIPGGNSNVNEHRNSKEHMENLTKMNPVLEIPEKKENKVFTTPATSKEFSLSDIPLEKMLEYHYIGDIIDCIECKVCDLKIRETHHTPAPLEYLSHTMSQEHKDNEMMFIDSWKLSMTSSYAAKASAPAKQQVSNNGGQLVNSTGKKKIPCLICGEKLEFQRDLHSHMTKHFWKRFLKIPLMTLEEKTKEEIPKENREESAERVIDKNEESNGIPETEPIESPEDEEDLEFNEEKLNDSLKQVHSPRQYRKKSLDIELDKKLNIYEIDKQRREDIKLGVLLSFTIAEEIYYCLVCRKAFKNTIQNSYEHLSSVDHLNDLQEMIEDHKKFRNYPGQLSDLALAHEYMQEISEHDVQCHACKIPIPNDPLKLNHHINDPSHTEKWSSLGLNAKKIFNHIQSRMEFDFYSIRKYWCVPCKERWSVEIEFRRHLNKKKHAKKIRNFESEMIFDYCAVCATLWYGFLKTYSYHSTCKMHKAQAYHNYYLMTKLPQSAERLLDAPEDQIEKIIDKVDTRRIDNKKKEDQLIRDLERISKVKYPKVKAYPFGSRVSGLGGKCSDLDIFLDCSTKKYRVYSGENSSYEQILVRLEKLQDCLEQDSQNWYVDRCITDCRIPIIKTTHRPTGIECDISFTNGLTVENTKIINAYCENYPDCRKLIIFIKNWMGHCEITGINGINSYGIAWLVIYFLQVTSILPSVYELIDRRKESRIIGGWETGVETDFQACSNDQSFKELLTKFFKFYATFDYRNNVMCPLIGESLKKINFQRPSQLPSAMKPYLNYLNEMDNPEPFRIDCVMCLQDPFDLGHNISKAVKKFMIYRLKTFCSFSAQILDNNAGNEKKC